MFVQSSRVAVHGIIAIICGNLAGRLMGFDKSFLSCGLFGYNSFLVGLAIATFDSSNTHAGYNWSAVIGVIIASYFSSVLFVMLGKMLAPYKVCKPGTHIIMMLLLSWHLYLTTSLVSLDTTIYFAIQYKHSGIFISNEANYEK